VWGFISTEIFASFLAGKNCLCKYLTRHDAEAFDEALFNN
jgi:hypothetical protein